jgi:glycosyltransferase involved in cell wall biosynthesis
LTIEQNRNPNAGIDWIKCVGHLSAGSVLSEYEAADGLLFLSRSESLGFPLLEAMCIGLPIICPDLPYARVLCGDEAIYFAPDEVLSLRAAVVELHRRLQNGWWPDWREATRRIPSSWSTVASSMLKIAAGVDASAGP